MASGGLYPGPATPGVPTGSAMGAERNHRVRYVAPNPPGFLRVAGTRLFEALLPLAEPGDRHTEMARFPPGGKRPPSDRGTKPGEPLSRRICRFFFLFAALITSTFSVRPVPSSRGGGPHHKVGESR